MANLKFYIKHSAFPSAKILPIIVTLLFFAHQSLWGTEGGEKSCIEYLEPVSVFAPHFKYRAMVVPKPKVEAPQLRADDQSVKSRISWARLFKRVFGIDVETCRLCGSKMKIIAAIEDPQVIKKILEHLDLPTKSPMPWPARGPPSRAEDDFQKFPDFDRM